MRVFATILLALPSTFAYLVISPGGPGGWTTKGPNLATWNRVDTDPSSFEILLTNQRTGYNETLNLNVSGALLTVACNMPAGGWPTGPNFRLNFAESAQDPDTLLAQSNEFNITAVSNGSATTSGFTATTSGTATSAAQTSSAASVSSSVTGTAPTGTSAASLGTDARAGLLTIIAVLTALITTLV